MKTIFSLLFVCLFTFCAQAQDTLTIKKFNGMFKYLVPDLSGIYENRGKDSTFFKPTSEVRIIPETDTEMLAWQQDYEGCTGWYAKHKATLNFNPETQMGTIFWSNKKGKFERAESFSYRNNSMVFRDYYKPVLLENYQPVKLQKNWFDGCFQEWSHSNNAEWEAIALGPVFEDKKGILRQKYTVIYSSKRGRPKKSTHTAVYYPKTGKARLMEDFIVHEDVLRYAYYYVGSPIRKIESVEAWPKETKVYKDLVLPRKKK